MRTHRGWASPQLLVLLAMVLSFAAPMDLPPFGDAANNLASNFANVGWSSLAQQTGAHPSERFVQHAPSHMGGPAMAEEHDDDFFRRLDDYDLSQHQDLIDELEGTTGGHASGSSYWYPGQDAGHHGMSYHPPYVGQPIGHHFGGSHSGQALPYTSGAAQEEDEAFYQLLQDYDPSQHRDLFDDSRGMTGGPTGGASSTSKPAGAEAGYAVFDFAFGNPVMYAGIKLELLERLERLRPNNVATLAELDALIPSVQADESMRTRAIKMRLRDVYTRRTELRQTNTRASPLLKDIDWPGYTVSFHLNTDAMAARREEAGGKLFFRIFRAVAIPRERIGNTKSVLYIADFEVPWDLT
ncbi:uncharacterized protein PFL1_00020 [Pseudozyma flocculosa PF-1]|uniref:uncharacterized protein n=1 Tax=Pseudozyma flocculosa PF-1 TaxID=1277687 RepID=UPI000456042C|nr:uncharacterized protein PFL1_00020 [Pseudozyma flocculosa PF-1]EPQ31821.1 hypothetical protein PFL1_00020 [Pseudozyma flocculosa PF-1]